MSNWYRLNPDHSVTCVPIAEATLDGDRRVAYDDFGAVSVSTVFLALDHGYGGGPPMLFETMVFGGPLDQEQVRYATWDGAVAGHAKMCERVRELMGAV